MKPVFWKLAPRTRKKPSPNGVRNTPGSVATTRSGSPNVPGIEVSSAPRSFTRVGAPASFFSTRASAPKL